MPLLSGQMTYEHPIKLLNEEKNGQDYATRFIHTGKRTVMANCDIYFDAKAPRFFYDSRHDVTADTVFPWGTTAGKIITLTAKNVNLRTPKVAGAEEKIQSMQGKAFGSSSLDDELSLIFT